MLLPTTLSDLFVPGERSQGDMGGWFPTGWEMGHCLHRPCGYPSVDWNFRVGMDNIQTVDIQGPSLPSMKRPKGSKRPGGSGQRKATFKFSPYLELGEGG